MREPQYSDARSQDLEPAYHDAEGTRLGHGRRLALGRSDVCERIWAAIVQPAGSRVQDIDTAEDWEIAEAKFRVSRQGAFA